VRGSGVASGYWNGRELQPVARTEDEGWYRTGDLGALDEQGNLFFKGRKKEVIVTPAGMNIYPKTWRRRLRGQNEVRDCAVVGLERGGNAEPCAVLILRDREMGGASVEEIVRRANETLAEYQRMRVWFVWPDDDFPRSSTQKPRRNAIRDVVEAALAGRATAADAGVRSTRPLAELLTRITGRTGQNLTPDANLESSLGLSSLERVELLGALETAIRSTLAKPISKPCSRMPPRLAIWKNCCWAGQSVVGSRSLLANPSNDQRLTTHDLQAFPHSTIRAGLYSGRLLGCVLRRNIFWRDRRCFC